MASHRRLGRPCRACCNPEERGACPGRGEIQYRDYEKEVGQGKSKQDVTMYVAEIFADSVRRVDRRKDDDDAYEAAEADAIQQESHEHAF